MDMQILKKKRAKGKIYLSQGFSDSSPVLIKKLCVREKRDFLVEKLLFGLEGAKMEWHDTQKLFDVNSNCSSDKAKRFG